MPASRESSGALGGVALAVGMIACCAVPLLLGAGITIGVAGLAWGSALLVAAGVTLGVWGWRRNAAHRCDIGEPTDQPSGSMPDRDQVSHR
ncbi:MAG: hypothetical protein ACRD0G_20440 [Acidimicrobiales bacterium]